MDFGRYVLFMDKLDSVYGLGEVRFVYERFFFGGGIMFVFLVFFVCLFVLFFLCVFVLFFILGERKLLF